MEAKQPESRGDSAKRIVVVIVGIVVVAVVVVVVDVEVIVEFALD